jgi:hypothetical protein
MELAGSCIEVDPRFCIGEVNENKNKKKKSMEVINPVRESPGP